MDKELLTSFIKEKAAELGFSACGIAKAEPVSASAVADMERWLEKGCAAGMDYMHRNKSLRYNPCELFPGAKSLIVVAMNYYPQKFQDSDISFAYYSYGKDYHFVLKDRLLYLLKYIKECVGSESITVEGRAFVDSAPLMEQFWAVKAGVGFRGRNSLVIVPGVGSFCFLGVLALNLELSYDKPLKISCGKCHKCEENCPTSAIDDGFVDANCCISYQTIENKSEIIPENVCCVMDKMVYGCDVCQKCCPWNNKFVKPTDIPEFKPTDYFLKLSSQEVEKMSNGDFKRLFSSSPILRIGKKRLLRNVLHSKKSCK